MLLWIFFVGSSTLFTLTKVSWWVTTQETWVSCKMMWCKRHHFPSTDQWEEKHETVDCSLCRLHCQHDHCLPRHAAGHHHVGWGQLAFTFSCLNKKEISNLNGEIAFFCSFFSIFPINHTVKRMQCQCDSTKGWVAGPYAPKILALRKIRLLTVLLMRLVKGSVMGSVLGLVKRSVWGDIAPPKLKSLTVPGLPSKYSPRTCVSGSSS